MLRNIEISGLRHFSGYVVQVDGLSVFYGKNGAGKSSIATAFEMLSAIAGRSLGDWTEVFGNCGALFYFGPECTKEIVLSVQRGRESYRAVLVRDPKDAERLILSREQLVVQNSKDDTQLEKIEVRTGERESIFGVPMEPETRDVYRIMREMDHWWIGHLVPSAMRNPETNDTGRRLYPTGQNLEACLLRFASTAPDAFSAVEKAVSEVEPEFVRFAVINEGEQKRLMWESASRAMLIPYQYFSEGTLRLLAYAVLFSSPELPEAVIIDDIETALDDGHIEAVMKIARKAGERTNIILTTRSGKVAECAGTALREIKDPDPLARQGKALLS